MEFKKKETPKEIQNHLHTKNEEGRFFVGA